MLQQYVLTLIGDDKPGLIDVLAKVVRSHGGSWLESRMANLAGKFSGIVLVTINADERKSFETAIADLRQTSGLSVRVTGVDDVSTKGRHTQYLTLVANDRPGILGELTSALASLGVNVEELTTDCSPAPMSSDVLFNATAKVSIPDDITDGQLRESLEALADDLIVEIN